MEMGVVVQISLWLMMAVPDRVQDAEAPSVVMPEQRATASDEWAAQVKAMMTTGRKRQEAIDRQNMDLWARWTHAVCRGDSDAVRSLHRPYASDPRAVRDPGSP